MDVYDLFKFRLVTLTVLSTYSTPISPSVQRLGLKSLLTHGREAAHDMTFET